jgi:hypothetical protein
VAGRPDALVGELIGSSTRIRKTAFAVQVIDVPDDAIFPARLCQSARYVTSCRW